MFHHFDIGPEPSSETRENWQGFQFMTQSADFPGKRLTPGYAKIVMALQSLVIVFFAFWLVEEYLNNIYFQAYVGDIIQTDGSLIAILVFVGVLGLALGLFKVLKSTHQQIGALANGPRVPTMSPVMSTPKQAVDLHPMVAALKADMAHQASMEPIPQVEIRETPPPPPVMPRPTTPPERTQMGTPSTVITGTMPVLKRVNPDQNRGQNSQQ